MHRPGFFPVAKRLASRNDASSFLLSLSSVFAVSSPFSSFDAKVNCWLSNRLPAPDVFLRCDRLQSRQLR